MKALVTGAGGFVGSHLVRELRNAGWRVVTTDRRGDVDLPGDLLKIPLRSLSVDVVFHLAGFANPSASITDPADAWRGNAEATARVAREVRARRIVIASTGQVYGPRSDRPSESAPVSPRTPYSASKLCSEALALSCGREVVVLRPYNHTGPGQSDAYVCPWIARQRVIRCATGGNARCARGSSPRRIFGARSCGPRDSSVSFSPSKCAATKRAAGG